MVDNVNPLCQRKEPTLGWPAHSLPPPLHAAFLHYLVIRRSSFRACRPRRTRAGRPSSRLTVARQTRARVSLPPPMPVICLLRRGALLPSSLRQPARLYRRLLRPRRRSLVERRSMQELRRARLRRHVVVSIARRWSEARTRDQNEMRTKRIHVRCPEVLRVGKERGGGQVR